MDRHVRNVGIANLLFGIFSALLALAILAAHDGVAGLYQRLSGSGYGLVLVGWVMIQLVTAIPCIIGGSFVGGYRDWARSILIFASALNVLNLPVGTSLAAYSLWVLFSPESDPLFLDKLHRRGTLKEDPPNPAASILRQPKPDTRHTPS